MRKSLLVTLLGFLMLLAGVSPQAAESKKEGAPAPKVKVGDEAPDFTLKDQSGKDVSLHDFRGKHNVVLAFYIFAFSGG
jgi:cytochrome oxidase Cu insertion factor (SCO1/SenC/PrrC family)